jgi:UDP-glucose 4-epimerase
MKGKRILITGGLGFIGSNLAHLCVSLGADVTVYDCLDPKSGGNIHNVSDIEQDLHLVLNDVRHFEGFSACIRGIHVVFHLAAYTSHPNSMKDPFNDIEVNCKGTINLLEAARRFNPDVKIVYVGTSTQTGRMRRIPVDELHPEFPVDIYSANKSASEKYVLIYGTAYRMRTTVVRLANVYGPRSNIRTPDFGFANYFIGLALKGKNIPVFGDGAQLRNLTYVEDVVEALVKAAASNDSDGEVFFAVGQDQLSVAQIAAEIVSVMGGKVNFIEWPMDRKVIELGDAVISNEKISRILDWNAKTDFRTGLEKTRDYFLPCLAKYME